MRIFSSSFALGLLFHRQLLFPVNCCCLFRRKYHQTYWYQIYPYNKSLNWIQVWDIRNRYSALCTFTGRYTFSQNPRKLLAVSAPTASLYFALETILTHSPRSSFLGASKAPRSKKKNLNKGKEKKKKKKKKKMKKRNKTFFFLTSYHTTLTVTLVKKFSSPIYFSTCSL